MSEDREIVLTTNVKAEKGYIYPTSRDAEGNITILKIKAGRKKKV